jgi:hypothetical protein
MFCCKPDSISRKLNLQRIAMYAVLVGILATPALSHAVEYTAAVVDEPPYYSISETPP